jgi:hypothetical protein
MQALAEQMVRDQFQVIQHAARDCNVIVAAVTLQISTRSVPELFDKLYIFVAYAPAAFPSADLPPARTIRGRVESSTGTDNRALWTPHLHKQAVAGERSHRGPSAAHLRT